MVEPRTSTGRPRGGPPCAGRRGPRRPARGVCVCVRALTPVSRLAGARETRARELCTCILLLELPYSTVN